MRGVGNVRLETIIRAPIARALNAYLRRLLTRRNELLRLEAEAHS
jgi:hypothetical protein